MTAHGGARGSDDRTGSSDDRSGGSDYRAEIDGLRALAVLAVIVDHFNKTLLPSGFLGVDIFFVISGYVISSSLYNHSAGQFRDFIGGFYSRRLKRLAPALVLCVVTTGLVICLFDPHPLASLRTGEMALFGLSNMYLLWHATDYFSASAQLNAFTHTWSLGVEEQFYVVFPLVFWFTGFSRRRHKGLRNLAGVLGLLAVGSLVLFVRESMLRSSAAFYLMPARFWELSAGCAVFVALNPSVRGDSARGAAAWGRQAASLMLLVALAAALFVPAEYSVCTTIAVVLLTALLLAVVRPETIAYKILVHPAGLYVGGISYSLYLWHWPVLVLSRWTVGIHLWTAPLQAGLMLLLAGMSYRFVESPLRRARWSAIRWRSILYGVGASACAAALLLGVSKLPGNGLYTGRRVDVEKDLLTDAYWLPDRSSSWSGEPCVLANNRQAGKVIPVEGCTLGDFLTAKHRILVVGNSYAAAFVPSFDALVMTDHDSVTITSSFGASPAPGVPCLRPWDKACAYYWGEVVPTLIARLRRGDTVFLVSDLAAYLPETPWSADAQRFYGQLSASLSRLSDELSARGIRLAVLDGLPFAREAECEPSQGERQWFAPFGGSCHFYSKEETLRRRSGLDETLRTLHQRRHILVVDLMDVFCPGQMCTYDAGSGEMLYRDDQSHPSVAAARLSAPIIREVLGADDR